MPYPKSAGGCKPNKGYVGRKRKTKLTRQAVLKMLAVMEASQNANSGAGSSGSGADHNVATTEAAANGEEFLQSGRTGRRNALADILSQHAAVTSSDLPSRLEGLTTKDKAETTDKNTAKKSEENKPGTSKS